MRHFHFYKYLLILSLLLGMTGLLGGQPLIVAAQTGNPAAYGSDAGAPNNAVFVKPGGNVGVGTTAPAYRLHVVAVGAQEAALFEAESGREYAGIRLRPVGIPTDISANDVGLNTLPNGGFGIHTYATPGQNGNWRLAILRDGKVGIGTATPSKQLEVVGDLKLSNGAGGPGDLLLDNPAQGYSGVALTGTSDGSDTLVINAVNTFGGGVLIQSHAKVANNLIVGGFATLGKDLMMQSVDQHGDGGRALVHDGGDTLALNYAGDFAGGVRVDSKLSVPVLQITGGDLAEPFAIAAADTIKPGMVVAIDPANPGQMRLATAAYDRTVAGVVSGAGGIEPGVLMYKDGAGEDTHPVALSGRVYVYADATHAPIAPGDLLTTADTPGHAMKVTDHARAQGAILGKAMSKLAKGKGLVLVLVTLQ